VLLFDVPREHGARIVRAAVHNLAIEHADASDCVVVFERE
jgi:hypothetical protein